MRKPHTLSKRNKNKLPYRIAFVDTETRQIQLPDGSLLHELKLGYCIVTNRNNKNQLIITSEYEIHNANDFVLKLLKSVTDKSRLIVVMHNINYDMPVLRLFTILPQLGYRLSAIYKEGMVGFASFKYRSRELLFVDNGNFFSGKLEKWGELVNRPKMDIDFNKCTDQELMTYCKNDVQIMVDCWQQWINFLVANDCGEFRITTASTAFNTYRHRFMPTKIYIHDNEQVINLERKAYRGGRVECLFIGERNHGQYYYVDINNMYGFVMREYEYPSIMRGCSELSSETSLERKLNQYSVIADVTVNVDKPYYPLKLDNDTVYPVGEFRVTLTTSELQIALDNGWIQSIHYLAWYEKSKLFSDYVSYFYSKRLEYEKSGNKHYAQIAKLLINSLYGKFGQLNTTQVIIGDCDPDITFYSDAKDYETGLDGHIIKLGGSIIHTYRQGESYDSFPAIAAHVTAFARLYLYNLIALVPKHHVFYMDTDSLIVDTVGLSALQHLINPHEIGKLKIEHESNDLAIYAPKDYRMGSRIRTKGIRANALKLDQWTFVQTQWSSIKGLIHTGNIDNYRTKLIQKQLQRLVQSGIPRMDGFIEPFTVTPKPDDRYAII